MKRVMTEKPQSCLRETSAERKKYIRASLALSMIPAVGAGRIRRLYDHFSDPMSVFTADQTDIARIETIGGSVAEAIRRFTKWDQVDRLLAMSDKHRMTLLTPFDDFYPPRLMHIYDPPAVLWVKGDLHALKNEYLAVVGTRRPTKQGRQLTIRLTRMLLHRIDAGIASGLAHGVDALAHRAALGQNKCTVAVMACGLDRIYPTGNRQLAWDIMDRGGALVSEYPPGTKPEAHHFPVRNRIVSGMSLGVLVTETGVRGGSMITVGTALDQGREVFAVPHDTGNEHGEGCNRIIQRGWGKLVCSVEDIIAELPPAVRTPGWNKKGPGSHGSPVSGTISVSETASVPSRRHGHDPLVRNMLRLLSRDVMHIDQLARHMKTTVQKLLPVLLHLELEGVVVQRPGKKFVLSEW